jgi:hemolysin activation/secretion protein
MKATSLIALLLLVAPALAVASGSPAAPATIVVIRGLVFLEDETLLDASAVAGVTGVDTSRAPTLDFAAFRQAAAEALGYPVNRDTIELMRTGISGYLQRTQGRLALVRIPPQDVTSGVVQVIVLPGRLGRVSVEGARWSKPEAYAQAISARPGEVLDVGRVRREVEALNGLGFRTVTPMLVPGEKIGETDIRLTVEEQFPWRFVTGYNDTGSRTTDRDRVFASVAWGNAFGRGDLLNYQFTGDPQLERLRSHLLGYTTMLPGARSFSANVAYAQIEANLPAPIEQSGESASAALRYEWPLASSPEREQRLIASLDYKRTDNNILFAAIPVTQNVTEIVQGTLGYSLVQRDRRGYTSLLAGVTVSPGGLAGRNDDGAFAGSRAFAASDYAYLRLDVSRLQRLSAGFAVHSSLQAQATTANLLGSEQLAFGGAGSVRGYEEGEVFADEGLVWRNELQLPAWSRPGGAPVDVQLVGFWDFGWARVHEPLPNERRSFTLSSAGLGVRLAMGPRLAVRFDYGWQLRESGLGGGLDHRGHVNASLTW